jgi:hypothetical protein
MFDQDGNKKRPAKKQVFLINAGRSTRKCRKKAFNKTHGFKWAAILVSESPV